MGKLDGKVAIITGGGTGIGRDIALSFAREGAEIGLCGRNKANLEEVAKEISSLGRRALPIVTDVSIKIQVGKMVAETLQMFGRLDILVNNAGISGRGMIPELDEDTWDSIIDTNLKGTFLCIQAVASYMIQQKSGRIVNISSVAGIRPPRSGMTAYCVSKAGVDMLTRTAAIELAPHGISVNSIAPGSIETSIYRKGRTPEQIEEWLAVARKAPIGRTGNPKEIASIALFLASDDSSFIQGHIIVADGGRNARMS